MLELQEVQLSEGPSQPECLTIPKIMILGRVESHKDGPRKEPSFFLFIDQYQLHEQKCPHAADGEPYLFLM